MPDDTYQPVNAITPHIPEITQPSEDRQWIVGRFSRFDKTVAGIMVLLLALVGLTALLGDRVGVTLEHVGPVGVARSTASIIIQFSETMKRMSVPVRLRVVQIPPQKADSAAQESDVLSDVEGTVSWNGSTATFRPAAALKPGAAYEVMLAAGAISDTARQVLSDYRYGFTVRDPRVAYLAPADSAPFDIWIAEPGNPVSAKRLTNSPSGIYDFSVSPDGSKIAFSEKNSGTGTIDIKLLDLDSGNIEQVTDCQDAECKAPVWRPDGQLITYERVDYNSDLSQVGKPSPTRIWVIDLTSKPYTTRPMFFDSQTLGYGLEWSADGQQVTFFDADSEGILVHDFLDDSTVTIPSKYGNTGDLSPDGTQVVFLDVVLNANDSHSYLQLVDVESNTQRSLSSPTDPVDDDAARWSPDGRYLVIGRRYTDDRFTRGKQ
jgi:Big-like domain-containing protein/prolyl oligopeptidase family protein/WD40 repeat protein